MVKFPETGTITPTFVYGSKPFDSLKIEQLLSKSNAVIVPCVSLKQNRPGPLTY
jgi:hypothetical protein